MNRSWSTLIFGPRLKSSEEHKEHIGPLRGVAVLGLDALASAAYGPEALLTTLLVLGPRSSALLLPLTVAIVAVILTVSASYRQTIGAYAGGASSFIVAKENLGRAPGLVAAAALALDYVLNVAVAIAAGAGAIVSAVPALLPHTLAICLAILAGLTVINLRGIRSTAVVFVVPAYLFIGTLGLTLAVGIGRVLAGDVAPPAETTTTAPAAAMAVATPWLLARAFANGSTAMTGIEAVSDGVPLFAPPSQVHARRTLALITACLVVLLLGLAVVCRANEITASVPGRPGYESILSRVVATIWGRGAFYQLTIAAIVAVLAFSANTSFADFPRVARLLALDRDLPEVFAHRGRRLVFSHGIVVLSVLSAILLVVFNGITDHLIPLFAVGALLSFTLSQAGMVRHWFVSRERHARVRMAFNLAGALATGATLVVVITAKFEHGAWISIVLIVAMYLSFCTSRRHYDALDRMTALRGPLDLHPAMPPRVVIPVRRWDRPAQKALHFAYALSQDVTIVQVLTPERETDSLTRDWNDLVVRHAEQAHVQPPRLVVLTSEYRELFRPLLHFIRMLADEDSSRSVAVVVPQIVEPRWYHLFYHNNTAALLKGLLLFRGGPRIIVVSTPWYVEPQS